MWREKMTNSIKGSRLEPQFNGFLFAPVGEDRHGMPLSVLSALARNDVDPWEEAAALASLTPEAAIERLASQIAPPPDGPSAHLEPRTIAARLIVLLPSHCDSDAGGRDSWLRSSWWPLVYLGMMLFVIGVQAVAASGQQPHRTANSPVQASQVSDKTLLVTRHPPR